MRASIVPNALAMWKKEGAVLVISDRQLAALSAERLEEFFNRVSRFAAERLNKRSLTADLEALFERGRTYGLSTERELAGYIIFGLVHETIPPQDDPEWVVACLSDRAVAAERRVQRLFQMAEQREGRLKWGS